MFALLLTSTSIKSPTQGSSIVLSGLLDCLLSWVKNVTKHFCGLTKTAFPNTTAWYRTPGGGGGGMGNVQGTQDAS